MIEVIEKHLGDVREATAKAIANATGLPQIDVTKVLHKMTGIGTVEREKRAGGGNEYVYWLAGAAPPAPQTTNVPPVAAGPTLAETVANLPPAAVGVVDAEVRICDLLADIERLTAERDAAQLKADTWRANAATLEARIDELTLGPVGARAPLFVTVGRNCKPQRHESIEKAQRRGRALVRSEKESEVLVLEPVGRIVRGTEWMPR
ncbi:1-pyrroline-5-carboxylate dehydrogenase [Burkholderia arboris]|uniref:1-pyrroline-5-carboxylate dehydrogenase n=1 Tax=Burkholderia arboris TaxID=488730 RepID=UPI00210CCD48|nr:1-pyrroline-5-carboxylate dehydrogenase [Burkholderia arboris]UTV56396.1 1-pyrroline-5-carboxylate dehydrogenase [Burkholderia arboris]UTV56455.1 1-pyrroline-5-carboxylate dehydrogenase [Burkholderia arboris]